MEQFISLFGEFKPLLFAGGVLYLLTYLLGICFFVTLFVILIKEFVSDEWGMDKNNTRNKKGKDDER